MKPGWLAEIWIYPVKALDGELVQEAHVTPGGSLAFDRRWAMTDASGSFMNGKRNRTIHQVRSRFDFTSETIRLEYAETRFDGPVSEAGGWLAEVLGVPVTIAEDAARGFPDDTDSPGPTVISRATLDETGSWFGVSGDEMRARLRPNLVLNGVPAFAEDRLFSGIGRTVGFSIGEVALTGINPCQRCVVPSRDPLTGAETPGFQKIFATKRAATLPEWVNREKFNHFYRVSVNTVIAPDQAGKCLRTGDGIVLTSTGE